MDFCWQQKEQGWLIYAYDRDGGEIVAYAWEKRDIATVRELDLTGYLHIRVVPLRKSQGKPEEGS